MDYLVMGAASMDPWMTFPLAGWAPNGLLHTTAWDRLSRCISAADLRICLYSEEASHARRPKMMQSFLFSDLHTEYSVPRLAMDPLPGFVCGVEAAAKPWRNIKFEVKAKSSNTNHNG